MLNFFSGAVSGVVSGATSGANFVTSNFNTLFSNANQLFQSAPFESAPRAQPHEPKDLFLSQNQRSSNPSVKNNEASPADNNEVEKPHRTSKSVEIAQAAEMRARKSADGAAEHIKEKIKPDREMAAKTRAASPPNIQILNGGSEKSESSKPKKPSTPAQPHSIFWNRDSTFNTRVNSYEYKMTAFDKDGEPITEIDRKTKKIDHFVTEISLISNNVNTQKTSLNLGKIISYPDGRRMLYQRYSDANKQDYNYYYVISGGAQASDDNSLKQHLGKNPLLLSDQSPSLLLASYTISPQSFIKEISHKQQEFTGARDSENWTRRSDVASKRRQGSWAELLSRRESIGYNLPGG